MAQTTGIVRGGLVINKIFTDSNKSQKNLKENTNATNSDMEKYQG